MLNDEQKKLIEDNIKLVYAFCSNYHITDEDDIADLECEFCRLIDTKQYNKDKGTLATFIWNSLNNYQKSKYYRSITESRTLPTGNVFLYLNKMIEDESDKTEIQELVGDDIDYFEETEIDTIINKIRMACMEVDKKRSCFQRKFTMSQLFETVVEAYKCNNGFVNGAEIARKFGVTRQNINIQMKELANIAKEYL